MMSGIYMIILTSFAVFGLFSLIEAVVMSVRFSNAPKSVTVMIADKSFSTYDSIQYMYNILYNNEIVLLSDDGENICPLATTVSPEELHRYITNALFTKN